MSAPINFQTITKDGKPAFAVVPYDEFMKMIVPGATIPHEVVEKVIKQGFSLPKAWREYLGLTQQKVAKRLGISQASLSQIEKPDKKLRSTTITKLAKALGLHPEQLRD
ncbi:MAG: helix-turn-helix transcriptional regulator [Desulfobacterales bacterium]|nr:helix-turn-helix transcriptional regulator [Desulfobacterales bacterium]